MFFSTKKTLESIMDIDDLLTAFKETKPWSTLPSSVVEKIFKNSNRNVEKMHMFRELSEMYNCVERNFIPIVKSESDIDMILALFSNTFENIAVQAVTYSDNQSKGSNEWKKSIGIAYAAYNSSLLCNPLMLTTYSGFIHFCIIFGYNDYAHELLSNYYNAKDKIMSMPKEKIGSFNNLMREKCYDIQLQICEAEKKLGLKENPPDMFDKLYRNFSEL